MMASALTAPPHWTRPGVALAAAGERRALADLARLRLHGDRRGRLRSLLDDAD